MKKIDKKGKSKPALDMANHEIVTIAAFLIGAQHRYTDTEDIAIKANEIAPGRFSWRKYKDQINIDTVRKRLWDAANPNKTGYLIGTERDGWLVTERGRVFAEAAIIQLKWTDLSKNRMSKTEQTWLNRERIRMLSESAYKKAEAGNANEISFVEAERFFGIDDYVIGDARRAKLERAKSAFFNDKNLNAVIGIIEKKVRDK